MKKYLILLFIGFFGTQCFAQSDYVATKFVYRQGKVYKLGDTQIILKQNVGNEVILSVDTVLEYKSGNSVYKAFEIKGTRNFYERLEQGAISLYKLKGIYVLEDGTKLTTFDKSNFRPAVASTLKCNGKDQSLSKLSWTKPSLSYAVRSHNKGECNADAIPHKKFGIVAGYNFITTNISTPFNWSEKSKFSTPSIGVFADLPILIRKGRLYFTVEGNYFAFSTTYSSSNTTTTKFIGLEGSGFNALASFKYMVSRGFAKPYVKLGMMGSFLNLNSPTGYVEATKSGNVVTLNGDPLRGVGSTSSPGLNVAVGVEIPLVKRTTLHLELRSTRSLINENDLSFGFSNTGISAGISF